MRDLCCAQTVVACREQFVRDNKRTKGDFVRLPWASAFFASNALRRSGR